MPEFIADRGERLDHFLARMMPEHSRSRLVAWIKEEKVLVDGRDRKASFALESGMKVAVQELEERPAHDLTPAEIELEAVYEDEYLLVVNKPRGLATHPASSLKDPSLVNALLARSHSLSSVGGSFRPGIVHRLDKETTGLLVIAKTDAAHAALAKQIQAKTAERRYFALVEGVPEQPKFIIDAPIRRDRKNRLRMAVDASGARAVSHVKVIQGSLLAVRLETGRTHQIRVHLSTIGLPVVGDAVYGSRTVGPLQLHAAYLAFDHPVSGERIVCYVEPPEDFMLRAECSQAAIETW